jgi:hypothetical protein
MNRFARGLGLALAFPFLLLAGCSGGSEGTVSGEVKVDGQPLKKGQIKFVPADGKSPGVDADVTEGKYTAKVPPGNVKVEIRGNKVVGKIRMAPESPEVEQIEELVAKEYNDQTTLTMTVQKGSQEKNFEVKSRK